LFPAAVVGCAGTPAPVTRDVYVPSISELKPEDYAVEIEKYTRIIQSDLHLDIQQHAHLYLASLYFSPMNPDRNYELALKHLETYALFDPEFVNGVDPRLLLAAIIEIKRISTQREVQSKQLRGLYQDLEILQRQAMASRGSRQDFQRANLKLRKRIATLQKKIRTLEKSNTRLNKTIEMLSTLDSRLEEKRSNFIRTKSIEEE
jgi:hypothetical protein